MTDWEGRHPQLAALVAATRRRMRLNRMLSVGAPALIAAGAVALAWAAAERVILLPEIGGWLTTALILGVIAAGAVAASTRIPARWAAWAADQWYETREAFSTAVELVEAGRADGLADRQVVAAEERAGRAGPIPVRPLVPTRLLGIGAALIVAAATLAALPNPQDVVRAERAADRIAVTSAAQALEETAEELRDGLAAAEREELAAELEELAAALAEDSVEEALERLESARAELAGRLDDDRAAQATALAGLAQELGREPLAGGSSVQDQLEALAAQAESGALEDPDAIAERLKELADALAAGPQGLSEALAEAGRAVAGGDPQAAATALRGASGAVSDAVGRFDAQAAAAAAAGAAGDAVAGLRNHELAQSQGQAAQGQGQGSGQGSGEGAGAGQGSGEGQGAGQGAGEGQGQGAGEGQGGQGNLGGAGGSGASGEIGAGGPGSGGEGGQGGRGRAGGGEDQPHEGDLDLQTVYDPPQRLAGAEELPLGGTPGPGGTEIEVGGARGAGERNAGLVPFRDVLAEYAESAARTIEQPGYPLRLRDTVRDYFDLLGGPR
jgi:hypothetical protein